MSDQVQELLEVPSEFVKDGVQFMRRCTKPDQQEFLRLCQAVGVGFLIMGAVGYVVKLGMSSIAHPMRPYSNPNAVHIPLNHALVGSA
ncbi:hypothetical protein CEP54_008300 [Fusarium duplospermum]|uniref:Protein transporter Sec61 subunit gamma n=1 Tax=Fusarium duplospermum TaxID=1325734 RepID=A0A428PWF7_9HYPO|nr:hypothetical protein CEP54_008300 [Fusarium duplospermum]